MDLKNHDLLEKGSDWVDEMSPFESIAHIATYEEIPIFGGQQLRQEMLLSQDKHPELNTFEIVVNQFERFGRFIGSQTLSAANATVNLVNRGSAQ